MSTLFKIEHVFKNIGLKKYLGYLNHPELNKMLIKSLSFEQRELIDEKITNNGQIIEWCFKVTKPVNLPMAMKKVFVDKSFSWIEHSRLIKKESLIYWHIEPIEKNIKFRSEGIWRLEELTQGLKRTVEGNISVDIPLVGKMLEAFIVNEVKNIYEEEAKVEERFYKAKI